MTAGAAKRVAHLVEGRDTDALAPYNAETVGARLKGTPDGSGKQAGDPRKAGQMMIAITEARDPPHQLVLGAWGVDAVDKRLAGIRGEFDAWRERGVKRLARRARRCEPLTFRSGRRSVQARRKTM